jgi:type I site-specific restriction-modification system R (restriction) subunit
VIVISDEAHRTQGGTLAMNMRKALPSASFIGFSRTRSCKPSHGQIAPAKGKTMA